MTKKYQYGNYYLGRKGGLYFYNSGTGGLYFLNNIENLLFEQIQNTNRFKIFDIPNGDYIGDIEVEDTEFFEVFTSGDLEKLEGIWGSIKKGFKKIGKGFKKIGKGLKKVREALRPTETVEVPVKAPFPLIPALIGGGILALGVILYLLKK